MNPMFSCPNCLSSALRAVAPELSSALPRVQRPSVRPSLCVSRQRNYAAIATRAVANKTRATGVPEKSGTTEVAPLPNHRLANLRQELLRLSDPVKLAENTKRLLRNGEEEKAVELVRLAGLNMSCVVSWNHIIDYNLEHRNVQRAWKLFNDMKKRGQKPDAYTFTTMLDGLASNAGMSIAMEKAEAVYNSMYAPNSPVKPNITHINAMLKVCSRAGNLDKMFEIAAGLPSGGKGSPDESTYVTILNAIRASVEVYSSAESLEDQERKKEQGISQAKRIWADVIDAWINGSLLMDETLVCAMGRVLLMSSPERPTERSMANADDVLSLAAQAMGIPRAVPARFWEKTRTEKAENDSNPVPELAANGGRADLIQKLDQGATGGANDYAGTELVQERYKHSEDESACFDEIPQKAGSLRQYGRPSQNALSMLLTACTHLRAFRAGNAYWTQLEKVVRPDQENCHNYLRLLRYQRASLQTKELIERMITPQNQGGYGVGALKKTYVIAMSVCARDNRNPNILVVATDILRQMQRSLETPSARAIVRFQTLVSSRGRQASSQDTFSAISIMHDLMQDLKGISAYGDFDPDARVERGSSRRAVDRSSTATNKRQPGKLSHDAKQELLEVSKAVESQIMRSLDYYSEEMGQKSHKEWSRKLQALRHWRLKTFGDGKPSKGRVMLDKLDDAAIVE